MKNKYKELFKLLKEQNKTIASVESFTGGLFASTIVSFPGSSQYFKGSLVTYSTEIKKQNNIDVSQGVINSRTALSMAQKGKEFFNVDYCLSFTGNAGPLVQDQKPKGLVYIAINDNFFEIQFSSKKSRNKIRKLAVKFALDKLCDLIK